MRVLIAIGVPRQAEAGAAAVVLRHAEELTRRGHDADCWFLDDLMKRPAKWPRFEALAFAYTLARRVLEKRRLYDVVNIHAPWGCVYGTWRRISHPEGAPPYVLTMHGSEERFVEAMREEDRKGRAWNFGRKNRAWHRVYHQVMFERSIKSADYGMVVSREGQMYAEKVCGAKPGRFRFVPNGAESEFFMTRDYTQRTPMRLLFVGTWLDRKGVMYLTEAFRTVAQRTLAVRLTVAGCSAGVNAVKEHFVPEIREKVDVVPFVSRAEMPALYAEHDIFVLPSLMEGMPLSLLEAMAAGMPITTTATGGMADMVRDGENGVLVPPADAAGLAAGIKRLMDSETLRRELGQTAHREARAQSWEQVTRQVEEVLELAVADATQIRQPAANVAQRRHQHQGGGS